MSLVTPIFRKRSASDLINLDTYTLDDHLIVSKAHGDKTYVGRTYLATPIVGGGGEFATVIQNIFKTCPDDSVLQVSLVSMPDHEAAEIYAQGKVHGGAMLQELIDRQKTLLAKAAHVGWQQDVPLLNRRILLVSLATPVSSVTEDTLADAKAVQADFLSNLRGCGFADAKTLSASELLGYYRIFSSIFEPYAPVELDEILEIKYQVFGPDQTFDFRDNKVGVFGGNTFCSQVTAKSYPEEPFQGLTSLLTGAPFNSGTTKEGGGQRILTPFILNTTVRIGNQRKEMDRVEKAIKSRQNAKTLPFKLGNEDPAATLTDLEYMRKMCSSGDGDKYVYASTTAFIFGKTPEQTVEAAMTLKGTFDKLGFDGRLVTTDGIVRWAQALPLNFAPSVADKLACECIMPSSAAGRLLPVYGDHFGNARLNTQYTGSLFVTRRGAAHYFDPFVSNSNFNGAIAATPGSGKSFLLQYLVANALAEGVNVFVLDNGRSLKKFTAAVNGEFNDFAVNSNDVPSLNPFTGLNDDDFAEQCESIVGLLMMMAFHNEPEQPGARIAMTEAVRSAYGQLQDDAEISTVVAALDSIRQSTGHKQDLNEVERAASNLVPRLKAFLESPARGQFFRGKGTINITNQFTVFEMSGLRGDDHLRKCVVFFVMNMLMNRIQSIKGRKLVMVDEAHDLFHDPLAAVVMEGIYLKGRKDKVSVWVVVQSMKKFADAEAGSVILNQSAWKLILGQEESEISGLIKKEILGSYTEDPYFRKLISSIETKKGVYSEVLFVGRDYYECGRLYVDRFTATLFSSEDEARDEVFNLMNQGMPAVDAVCKVMGDKSRSRKDYLQTAIAQMQFEDPGLTKIELLKTIEEIIQS